MSKLRTAWDVFAHDRRFLVVVLVMIELYYVYALATLPDITAIETPTFLIKYVLPMSAGGFLLYRGVSDMKRKRK